MTFIVPYILRLKKGMLNRQAKLKQLGEKLASFPSDWYRKYVVIQKQRTKGSSPALGSIRVIYFQTEDGNI